jgi:hypothetical protein
MKLKNYSPAGNEVLVELKEYSSGIVIQVKPEHEKIMKVLKVGPTVTALNPLTGKTVAPGDFVMLVAANLLQLTFEPLTPEGYKVQAVQAKEFAIGAYYLPDSDETKFFPHIEDAPVSEERDMKIFDNPGIEHSPYLKEEAENKLHLNN